MNDYELRCYSKFNYPNLYEISYQVGSIYSIYYNKNTFIRIDK